MNQTVKIHLQNGTHFNTYMYQVGALYEVQLTLIVPPTLSPRVCGLYWFQCCQLPTNEMWPHFCLTYCSSHLHDSITIQRFVCSDADCTFVWRGHLVKLHILEQEVTYTYISIPVTPLHAWLAICIFLHQRPTPLTHNKTPLCLFFHLCLSLLPSHLLRASFCFL